MRYILSLLCWLCLLNIALVGQENLGKKLFRAKCLICHGVSRDLTGPALVGVRLRVGNDSLLYAWIRNNKKVLASGNPYFTNLYKKWNKAPMNVFEELSDKDITAILNYVESKAKEEKQLAEKPDNQQSSKSMLIISLIIGVLILILGLWWLKKAKNNIQK